MVAEPVPLPQRPTAIDTMGFAVPEQLLLWQPNLGGPVNGDATKRQVETSEPTKYQVTVHCGESWVELTLWVVALEMTLDRDEIFVNSDDGDDSGVPDLTENYVPGEDDLASLTARIVPPDAPTLVPNPPISLMHSGGVELWEFSEKILAAQWGYEWLPYQLYVEGRQVSSYEYVQMEGQFRCFTDVQPYQELYLRSTVSLSVRARDGESMALLEICKDEGLVQKVAGGVKIGGTVYPVLQLEIPPGQRTSTTSADVTITDLYPDYFEGTNVDYALATIDFTQPTGWEVKSGGSWSAATVGPAATDNKNGAGTLYYRYKMEWTTHRDMPHGNNGKHKVWMAASVGFQEWVEGTGWTNAYECGPCSIKPECENVYIDDCSASPGNIDYFKWDPDGEGGLATPTISFSIVDADPHKYCGIIRFRETIGYGTWDWDSGWSSMRFDCGTSTTPTINLAEPDSQGDCLEPNLHPWGTYTYEILILEYETTPVWTQGEALDWNFLKRYRDGYHLWVPEFLPAADPPPPDGTEPGHYMWRHSAAGVGTQFRAYYSLHNTHGVNAGDVELVAVDPWLAEAACLSGPGEVGVAHGTGNEDGEPGFDGLCVYSCGPSDGFGTWRVLWTASDLCGPQSTMWRTHDEVRMLVANRRTDPPYHAEYSGLPTLDQVAVDVWSWIEGTGQFSPFPGCPQPACPPAEPYTVRMGLYGLVSGLQQPTVVLFGGHGETYGTKTIQVDPFWDEVEVTDDAAAELTANPFLANGDTLTTREHLVVDDDTLSTRRKVAKYHHEHNRDAYALVHDGSDDSWANPDTQQAGFVPGSYNTCMFAFVSACNSARTDRSFLA